MMQTPGNTDQKNSMDKEMVEFYSGMNLRVKQVDESDLTVLDALCSDAYFDVGYNNLKLYYETSPDTWRIVYDKNGQAIVADGINKLSNGIEYAYLIIVRRDWRGKGLSRPFALDISGSVMASSTEHTIKADMQGPIWLEKRHGLYVPELIVSDIRKEMPSLAGVRIEPLRAEYVADLLRYDERICLINRREFVRKWSSVNADDQSATVVAVDEKSGACLGYGTLRLFSYYYGIQPLYADSDQIALALMTALVKWFAKDGINLYMPLIADKAVALKFCYSIGMVITGTEMRNCTRKALQYAKSLPVGKVYSVHEYYPV